MLGEQKRYPANYSETRLYIKDTTGPDIKGTMYHPGEDLALEFESVQEMIDLHERLFNALNFPQATHRLRGSGKDRGVEELKEKAVGKERIMEEKPTFIIKVHYRQNATWQGTVQWVEGQETKNFRSVLELIKLLDEAVDTEDGSKIGWEK